MPPIALLLTLAAAVPFIACGLAAVGQSPEPAARMLAALIDYAALMLAFSGGMYWALVLLPGAPEGSPTPGRGAQARLAASAVPVLLAWAALISTRWMPSWISLGILIGGYVVTLLMERHAGLHAALPRQHVWIRWGFTLVAVAMMTTVLVLRLFGRTIVF